MCRVTYGLHTKNFSLLFIVFYYLNAQPDTLAGDVVVVLQEKEHEWFMRDGPNLVFSKTITLIEALAGFMFYVRHLDRRTLVVCKGVLI